MTVYRLNPLQDPRWTELVDGHPQASIFHTRGWLQALQRTYGFEPMAFTSSAPAEPLANAMAFCGIRSWLTGRRLVSLPFSDHCDPLVRDTRDVEEICASLEGERQREGWKYIELRPRNAAPAGGVAFAESARYCLHMLDLRPEPGQLFQAFHLDSTQRKIRRAEREGLTEEEGRSPALLHAFYFLVLLTRRRHQLPPQPFAWFRNLVACLGPAVTVRLARHGGQPIAGVLTLRHRDIMVYKYGASDAAFHRLGGMQFLLWRAIQAARRDGCVTLDLGRSDLDQPGLIAFKDRLGASRSGVACWRRPLSGSAWNPLRAAMASRARQVLGRMPGRYQAAAGRIFYRHAA